MQYLLDGNKIKLSREQKQEYKDLLRPFNNI